MPGRVKSVEASRFAMVPRNDVPRSAFTVQHGHKTTFNAGYLVPVFVDEVLPGDSIKVDMTAFCRLSTPLVPIMDNLELESFFFFVPNRLIWENWERFMGEQNSPSDTTQFLTPYVEILTADLAPGSLGDYLGVTLNNSANTLRVSALPFRAYNRIWNDWFRDEDLEIKMFELVDDGPDTITTGGYGVNYRCKRHDYFTTCRPWPQKPFQGNQLPSTMAGASMPGLNAGFEAYTKGDYGGEGIGAPLRGFGVQAGAAAIGPVTLKESGNRAGAYAQVFDTASATPMYARVSAGGYPDLRILVNDMRTAVMVQQMLERNARGGTRYAELVRSHFGVISPDARLQRPEFLGGGRTMIQVNPVAQTSASGVAGTTTKLGELAAIGSGMATGHGFSQSFTEHGIILGLVNVRSYLTYQQGNHRMWNRRTQFDFYWPGLAHLGEQAVLSQEIFADGSADDVTVFGYQERWAEYKFKPSRTSGFFRSTDPTPLDMWHLGEKFASRPALNTVFIQENPPVDRVLQVATNFGEQFLFDSLFDIRYVRCMPMYSIPGVWGGRL